jgi:hypothetical protein
MTRETGDLRPLLSGRGFLVQALAAGPWFPVSHSNSLPSRFPSPSKPFRVATTWRPRDIAIHAGGTMW